jgi:hypothetical protein
MNPEQFLILVPYLLTKINRFWSKTVKRKSFLDEKIFGKKNKILNHSENFKLTKTHLLPHFQPLRAKIIQNLIENLIEIN